MLLTQKGITQTQKDLSTVTSGNSGSLVALQKKTTDLISSISANKILVNSIQSSIDPKISSLKTGQATLLASQKLI
jgi:hypothetical protein